MIEVRAWRLLVPLVFALSACARLQQPGTGDFVPARPSIEGRAASPYRILYQFHGGKGDGAEPEALINVRGSLFGTTGGGGGSGCDHFGCGTVFSMDATSGREHVLYRFRSGTDGQGPQGNLVLLKGSLYGTTSGGGCVRCSGSCCGTIYSVSTTGKEHVLYRFRGGANGAYPYDGLVTLHGELYGATFYGGNGPQCGHACGTIYVANTAGDERVLYAFKGGRNGYSPGNGYAPYGPLLAGDDVLFGTTDTGGYGDCCGTVFSVTTSGSEHVIYRFRPGYDDGIQPFGGLVAVYGTLYGTTGLGGTAGCPVDGCGTVFAVTRAGSERIVYEFKGGTDGSDPVGTLTYSKGALYGTTGEGGGSGCGGSGCGTVFSLSGGIERPLHRFTGGNDGANPGTNLLLVGGKLYGVTLNGGGTGCGGSGCGTIFELTP